MRDQELKSSIVLTIILSCLVSFLLLASRNRHKNESVTIVVLEWKAVNLDVSTFNNGDQKTEVKKSEE